MTSSLVEDEFTGQRVPVNLLNRNTGLYDQTLPPILRVQPNSGDEMVRSNNYSSAKQSELQLQSSNSDYSLDMEKTQQHFNTLQQLLTHVPNLVIRFSQKQYTPQLPITFSANHGVFMFIDVSGFTALCEKYCSDISAGKRGIDALTNILNKYLGNLVQVLIESNGDVLKFAGDAILALWPYDTHEAYEMLMWVIKTALLLQDKHDNFRADENSVLRVKVAISVGEYSTHIFGCNDLLQFAVCGRAVASVNRAQNVATSGSVILSPEAWDICNQGDLEYSQVPGGFYRVTALHFNYDSQWMQNYWQSNSEAPPLMHSIFLSILKNETDKQARAQKKLKKARADVNSLENDRKQGKSWIGTGNIRNGIRRLSTFQFKNNSFRKEAENSNFYSTTNEPFNQIRSAFTNSSEIVSRDISQLSSIAESVSRNSSRSNMRHYRDRKSTLNSILQEQMAISKQLKPGMLDNIRKFLSRAVRSKIDSGQSMEWLSELRTISVLFINLDVCIEKLSEEKIKLIQEALVYVQEVMNDFDGVVNKIFMFDKGCTILALFGLPHSKHEDDATRALQASSKIFSHLSSHLKLHTSIGITTGQAFCGVVGHNLRHEYTAIGAKVNMAARLMMNFREKITCDHTTKLRSGVAEANFSEMPAIPLKGIEKPEQIYSFSTRDNSQLEHYAVHVDTSQDKDVFSELIGRGEELEILQGMLNQITLDENPESHILIITGDTGIGKTTLLRSMKHLARKHSFRVLSCRAGLMEMGSHYHTVRILIERLLQLETCRSLHEREQAILTQFQDACDDDIIEYLPLLNDLLMLKYTQTDKVSHLTGEQRHSHLHRLLFNIVEQETSNQSCVFVVDDAHYMDNNSWEFLQDLSNHQKVILVLAMKAPSSSKYPKHLRTMMSCKNVRVCQLKGLDHESILELAKRLLNVATIGGDFEKFLKKKLGAHGNPMWCEEALETMLNLGLFHIEPISNWKCSSMNVEAARRDTISELKSAASMDSNSNSNSTSYSIRRQSKVRFAAHVDSDAINLPLPESLNDLILARLDRLSASSQLVLKCAAVVGTNFSRSILKQITPNNIKDSTLGEAIERLIQAGMIECAYASAYLSSATKNHAKYQQLCSCIQHLAHKGPAQPHTHNLHGLHSQDQSHFHIYYRCDLLKFTHNYIQEIVYELWTNTQRKVLHETAAKCLESEAHKCRSCGGGAFLNGIHQLETALSELKEEEVTNEPNQFDAPVDNWSSLANHTNIGKRKRSNTVYIRKGGYRSTLTPSKNNLTQGEPGISIDLSQCTCSEVLATVYPQLVRHWKESFDYNKMFHYLLEAALASTQVHATLEAQSLLEEAEELIKSGKVDPTQLQRSRFALIKGQSFYNGHHYAEAQQHFLEGLTILKCSLPSSCISFLISLVRQSLPQVRSFLNSEYNSLQPQNEETELTIKKERMTLLSFLVNTYSSTNQRYRMLVTTLTLLNQAQSCGASNRALMDSYRMMLRCCELFRFKRGILYYQSKTALTITQCESRGNENITELISYIELVTTLVNEQLYGGNLSSARNYAKRAVRLSRSLRALDQLLDILPLWCYIHLHSLELSEVSATLEELRECALDSDDLQQQALYFCYCFDIILETGIVEEFVDVIECESYARTCTSNDVFHFNTEERFFLLSCLTLWYARKEIEIDARIHFSITKKIMPRKIESFFAAKGLLRFTECALLLWAREQKSEFKKMVKVSLSKLVRACHTYTVLKPRMLLLRSFYEVVEVGSGDKWNGHMFEAQREAAALNSNLETLWIQHHIDFWNKKYNGVKKIEKFTDSSPEIIGSDRMKLDIYSLQRERKMNRIQS